MQKLRNEKGITLIALALTVFILSLISVPVLVNMTNINQFDRYADFKNDIDILRESISAAYYNKNIKEIGPKYEGDKTFLNGNQNGKNIKNVNDNDNYYAININKVNKNLPANMTELKNGEGNKKITDSATSYSSAETDDVYIINEQSKTIYYVRGVNYNGETYYRLNEEFSETDAGVVANVKVEGFNKTFTDIYRATAKIPVGYKVSSNPDEQIVSKGLVILDDNGNEFVWIPVQKVKKEDGTSVSIYYDRYEYGTQTAIALDVTSDSMKITNSNDTSNYFYETKDNFEATSAIENGGFYIGRYKTKTTVSRTSGSSNENTILNIKNGTYLYNYVTETEAKKLAEGFISSNSNVKSRLCSSYAWDTALKFIEQTLGKSSITTTGTNALNNINELNGNSFEWTTESCSNSSNTCTKRGGTSPSTRTYANSSSKDSDIGFRIALFLSI